MDLVILQPFYLPYSGVFELIRLADTFLFLDDVKVGRSNWMTRNQIKTDQGPQWLSVTLSGSRNSLVNEAAVNDDEPWRAKHRDAIATAYEAAPHVGLVLDTLDPFWEAEWESLADLNVASVQALSGLVGVTADFQRSSDLDVAGSSSDRVLALCLELGADRYISGPAARAYLDESSFEAAGVELLYHHFTHPEYHQQHGEFVPYLSVVDLIANEADRVSEILPGCGRGVPAAEWEEADPAED